MSEKPIAAFGSARGAAGGVALELTWAPQWRSLYLLDLKGELPTFRPDHYSTYDQGIHARSPNRLDGCFFAAAASQPRRHSRERAAPPG